MATKQKKEDVESDEECNLDCDETHAQDRKVRDVISARNTPIKSNILAHKNIESITRKHSFAGSACSKSDLEAAVTKRISDFQTYESHNGEHTPLVKGQLFSSQKDPFTPLHLNKGTSLQHVDTGKGSFTLANDQASNVQRRGSQNGNPLIFLRNTPNKFKTSQRASS